MYLSVRQRAAPLIVRVSFGGHWIVYQLGTEYKGKLLSVQISAFGVVYHPVPKRSDEDQGKITLNTKD
jgi:hypothetical protein